MLISGSVESHLVYALAWLSFSVGHSLLACDGCKWRLRPRFGAFYRVFYNAFAAIHLGLVWWLGDLIFRGRPRFDFSVEMHDLLFAVYAVGWLVMLLALRGYDLGRLAGIHQIRGYLRGGEDSEDEHLRLDGLHRYVRHPLYSGVFLILWGRVTGDFELATAVWASLYLLVGAWLEERRLLGLYGAKYAQYRRRVPAFVPWRGRVG